MPRGNSNIAVDSSPMLQISLEILALFEKIYDGKPILTAVSNIGEDFNTVVSIKSIMWKVYRSQTLKRYWESIKVCK